MKSIGAPDDGSAWFGQHPEKIVRNQVAEISESDETQVLSETPDKVRLNIFALRVKKHGMVYADRFGQPKARPEIVI